jgi:hypothetical protein
MPDTDCSYEETSDQLHADPAQLSPGEMLLASQSLKRFRLNSYRTATNVAATSSGSVALLADPDDDACENPTARAATDRTRTCPLAMAFGTCGRSCWRGLGRTRSDYPSNSPGSCPRRTYREQKGQAGELFNGTWNFFALIWPPDDVTGARLSCLRRSECEMVGENCS